MTEHGENAARAVLTPATLYVVFNELSAVEMVTPIPELAYRRVEQAGMAETPSAWRVVPFTAGQFMSLCDYCGAPIEENKRFCCDLHRSRWHREHEPVGTIRSVRALRKGAVSVTVHFPAVESQRALSYPIGAQAVLGRVT